jgi:hypothetical protein
MHTSNQYPALNNVYTSSKFLEDSPDFSCPTPPVELEESRLHLRHDTYYFEAGMVTFLVSVLFSCCYTTKE